MYKKRVENDRNFFEIPFLLPILRTRKSSGKQSGKIQNICVILNFPALNFLVRKIKEWEFQKNLCRSLPIYIHTYPEYGQLPFYVAYSNSKFRWPFKTTNQFEFCEKKKFTTSFLQH